MIFPKRKTANVKGVGGQSFFQDFVNNELNCIYHPINQENDFGIDGYVELVINENVTGKLIGVQLKHGNSYFENKTITGYKYLGENKHLNYYLNNQSPIFLIIMNDNFEIIRWVEFDIGKTSPNKNGWWIEIPEKNILNIKILEIWIKTVGPLIDFEKHIKLNWKIDQFIQESKFSLFAIPKSEIETYSFNEIKLFINRISKSKEMMLRTRSTLDIFFPEYDDDNREIFNIPEIMNWLHESIEIGIPWFYYLNYRYKNAGLTLLLNSYCKIENLSKKEKGYLIEFENKEIRNFINKNFINMNNYLEENNIEIKINKEISAGIIEYYNKKLINIE